MYLYRYKSVREGKKVRHVFVEYLGIEGKDGKPIKSPKRILDRVVVSSARKYGAVCVLWRLCQQMGLDELIDSVVSKRHGFSAGRLLILLAINRCIRPKSLTGFSRWYAKTWLPELAGLSPESLSKDNLLSAMDAVCGEDKDGGHDFTLEIEKKIFSTCRKALPEGAFSTFLYDITNAFFHGGTCVLAELGYTPKGTKKKKIHIALVVTRRYHIPIFHMVFRGSVQDALTAGKLLDIMDNFGVKKVTLVWDRGVTSATNVGWADTQGIDLICGLRRDLVEIRELIECTVPETPSALMRRYGDGAIYAVGKKVMVFGKKRKVIIYLNTAKRDSKRMSRNEKIKRAISEIVEISGRWSDQEKVRKKADAILKRISDYVKVSYRIKDGLVFVDHRIDEEALDSAARLDGKYAIMSTDLSMSVEDVVNAYFGKSEIERAFRAMKQVTGLEPIRHRQEFRVRAHMFVCFMAYLLYSVLAYKLKDGKVSESVEEVLERLDDVEKIKLTYGKQIDERYLNLGMFESEALKKLKMDDICQTKPIDRTQM